MFHTSHGSVSINRRGMFSILFRFTDSDQQQTAALSPLHIVEAHSNLKQMGEGKKMI